RPGPSHLDPAVLHVLLVRPRPRLRRSLRHVVPHLRPLVHEVLLGRPPERPAAGVRVLRPDPQVRPPGVRAVVDAGAVRRPDRRRRRRGRGGVEYFRSMMGDPLYFAGPAPTMVSYVVF